MMKIVFFGSDDFALKNLERLYASGHAILACVTQPDRPKGRGLKIAAPLIKTFAQKKGISVCQPTHLEEERFVRQLQGYRCDLFVVIAYGKILPASLLQIPRLGAINAHASLLPKYRGAAPINWAIMHGERQTGISIIKLNPVMDAGDIISQAKLKIAEEDDALTLRAKLIGLSAQCLCQAVASLEKGDYSLTPQDRKKVSLAPKLTKPMGKIDWRKTAGEIHNLVRGLLPWPTAYTYCKGKMLKILATEVVKMDPAKKSYGEVADVSKHGILIVAGQDALLMKEVHLESAKVMDARAFAVGHNIKVGFRFE